MAHAVDERTGHLSDGLVQLRFADDAGAIHDLNAAELAEVLQGLVEHTSDMAKAGMFGDGMPPEVRVRPPQAGSVIIEAVLHWSSLHPEAAAAVAMPVLGGGAGGLVMSIRAGIKYLTCQPADFDYLDNGNVKVQWTDGTAEELPVGVWMALSQQKVRRKRTLRKLMAPLGDDADRLEVRGGQPGAGTAELLTTEPVAVGTREDYRAAATGGDEQEESIRTFEVEASLSSIDFREGGKWRVSTAEGTLKATIEDYDFLRVLDEGMALHKNDLFTVRVREVTTTTNGRPRRQWTLEKISRKRRGGDDGDDAPTPPRRSS